MHRLQAGAFAVLVAGSVVGVSALATQTTETTERPVASTATPSTIHTTSLAQSGLNEQPQATAQPIAVAAKSSTTTAHDTSGTRPICNESLRVAAVHTRATRLFHEASRHKHVLWSLQTTGLVTRFLNPNMYSYRLDHETAQHRQALRHIDGTYRIMLSRAHCV